MEENLFTPSNVMFVLGVIGLIIGVYKSIFSPQTDLDKREALNDAKSDNTAATIAQRAQWEREATERRFKELDERNKEAMTLAQNHIHTVDTKLTTMGENLGKRMGELEIGLARLATVIEERIPKK